MIVFNNTTNLVMQHYATNEQTGRPESWLSELNADSMFISSMTLNREPETTSKQSVKRPKTE